MLFPNNSYLRATQNRCSEYNSLSCVYFSHPLSASSTPLSRQRTSLLLRTSTAPSHRLPKHHPAIVSPPQPIPQPHPEWPFSCLPNSADKQHCLSTEQAMAKRTPDLLLTLALLTKTLSRTEFGRNLWQSHLTWQSTTACQGHHLSIE